MAEYKPDMLSLITKKKLGGELSKEEIEAFVKGVTEKTVPDYQTAAMLMAIRFVGMKDSETTCLTLAMRDSGDAADMSSIPGIKVDKHSTGGVGDTVTLVLAPLAAACGVPIPKLSGRGLGHTGGTIDKLESIPGMRVEMDEEEFIAQVKEIGIAVMGQTKNLAPADKILYSLRDVTSTVDSIPLVASSIMSKKLAGGADGILLDVKSGSGAVMNSLEDSILLAETMVNIGQLAGKKVSALVTDMNQPLGTHVGNALEVKEAIDILSGRTGGDLLTLSLALGGHMLALAEKADSPEEGERLMENALRSGAGLEKLRQMIEAQGGNPAVCDDTSLLPQAPVIKEIKAGCSADVGKMNTTALGLAAQNLGAGRKELGDELDYSVGFVMHARIGDRLEENTPFFTIHARCEEEALRAEEEIRAAVELSEAPVERPQLIYRVIKNK